MSDGHFYIREAAETLHFCDCRIGIVAMFGRCSVIKIIRSGTVNTSVRDILMDYIKLMSGVAVMLNSSRLFEGVGIPWPTEHEGCRLKATTHYWLQCSCI